MRTPTVVHYITMHCPICFVTKQKLRLLEIEGIIRLLEVDVEATGGNELFGKYMYFIKRVLGGSVEVPVILLLDSQKWHIPKQRTKVGKAAISFSESVEVSVDALMTDLLRDITNLKPKPVPFSSHQQMIEGMIHG